MLSKIEFERNEDTDGNQMVAVYKIDEGQCRDGILQIIYIFYKIALNADISPSEMLVQLIIKNREYNLVNQAKTQLF